MIRINSNNSKVLWQFSDKLMIFGWNRVRYLMIATGFIDVIYAFFLHGYFKAPKNLTYGIVNNSLVVHFIFLTIFIYQVLPNKFISKIFFVVHSVFLLIILYCFFTNDLHCAEATPEVRSATAPIKSILEGLNNFFMLYISFDLW